MDPGEIRERAERTLAELETDTDERVKFLISALHGKANHLKRIMDTSHMPPALMVTELKMLATMIEGYAALFQEVHVFRQRELQKLATLHELYGEQQ